MNKREFVNQRRGSWVRFDRMTTRMETASYRKLKRGQIGDYSKLFREVSHDLAIVRSEQWGGPVESYLNHLATRGHNAFYRAPPGRFQAFLKFLASGYPRVFRRNWPFFAVAAALFFVPLIVTWIVVQQDSGVAARIIDRNQLESMESMYDYDPDDPDRSGFDEARIWMSGFYVHNNVGIALRAFAAGALFGVVTIYVLLQNGIFIGAVAGFIIGEGHGKAFTSFVISHGAFELTAIAIAGGAGLMLGDALLHRGQRTWRENLQVRGIEAVQIAGGAAAMLMIAALLEAFWSPSGIPSLVKYAVGAGLWVLVILYLCLAGRETNEDALQYDVDTTELTPGELN